MKLKQRAIVADHALLDVAAGSQIRARLDDETAAVAHLKRQDFGVTAYRCDAVAEPELPEADE